MTTIYVKIPDTLYLAPAMLAVSTSARWTNVAAWMYCSTARSDGFVPEGALGALGADLPIALELEAAGLWLPAPGGWTVDGYLPLNRTRAQIEEISGKRKITGQMGGQAKARQQVASGSVERRSSNADAAVDLDPLPFPERELGTEPTPATADGESLAICYEVPNPATVARLEALGVDAPEEKLATYGDELVTAWLDELPNKPSLTNPAGYLVGRLRAGERPPAREPAPESALARIAAENAAAKLAALPPLQAVGE